MRVWCHVSPNCIDAVLTRSDVSAPSRQSHAVVTSHFTPATTAVPPRAVLSLLDALIDNCFQFFVSFLCDFSKKSETVWRP
jgi:hypothetical protein